MKFNKICILGLGYIGLPTASMFAMHGIKVVGVDINPFIIETLQAGHIHIHEPGLGEAVGMAVKSGNLSVATRPEPADAFLIAVPTPFYEHDLIALQFWSNNPPAGYALKKTPGFWLWT